MSVNLLFKVDINEHKKITFKVDIILYFKIDFVQQFKILNETMPLIIIKN